MKTIFIEDSKYYGTRPKSKVRFFNVKCMFCYKRLEFGLNTPFSCLASKLIKTICR